MENFEEKREENKKPDTEVSPSPPKVSAVYFDERTGTITLRIATEEEIAEAEKLRNQ